MSPNAPKLLLIAAGIVALAAVSAFTAHWQRQMAQADPRLTTGEHGVVMLGASWCGYCQRLKVGLDAAKVPYVELDVEDGGIGENAFFAVGGRGVPVTVIGQEVVHGYDAARLTELLGKLGHSIDLK